MPCLKVGKAALAHQQDLQGGSLCSDLPGEAVAADLCVAGVGVGDRAGIGDLVACERAAVIGHRVHDGWPRGHRIGGKVLRLPLDGRG